MYHDHLLKYARIALGTGLEDHFYRQNTRVPMYDIIMQSQALQENSFSEVRFRVCQLFLKAVSLLAFLFPEKWAVKCCQALYKKYYSIVPRHSAYCTLKEKCSISKRYRYNTAIGIWDLLSGTSSYPHAAFYIWIFNLAEGFIKTCVAPKLPVDHTERQPRSINYPHQL